MALVATAANAEVSVTCNGQSLENGGEYVINKESFKLNEDLAAMGWWYWEASAEVEVEAKGASDVLATTTSETMQLCEASGNCFPWMNGKIEKSYTASKYGLAIHRVVQEENIPVLDETMTLTITDSSNNPFTFKIRVLTEDSGVNEIMTGSDKVAAIYDMQGRRVREDFRGMAIVVYENGRAVKRIVK